MYQNGFYAAMKTDEGLQAVYIDEGTIHARQRQEAQRERKKQALTQRKRKLIAEARKHRAGIRVLKQELKLLGMGGVLYWGFCAGLVEMAFAVPVLLSFQTVICFRAGRWFGNRETK